MYFIKSRNSCVQRMQEIKMFLKALREEKLNDEEYTFFFESDISRAFVCKKPDMDSDAQMTFHQVIDPYIQSLV